MMSEDSSESYQLCDCDWIETGPDYPCGCGEEIEKENARLVENWNILGEKGMDDA